MFDLIKFASVAGGAIGVQIKSLFFVLVKSHNLVFSGVPILAKLKQASKSNYKGTNFFCIFDKMMQVKIK
jgi:hypothetical protein